VHIPIAEQEHLATIVEVGQEDDVDVQVVARRREDGSERKHQLGGGPGSPGVFGGLIHHPAVAHGIQHREPSGMVDRSRLRRVLRTPWTDLL